MSYVPTAPDLCRKALMDVHNTANDALMSNPTYPGTYGRYDDIAAERDAYKCACDDIAACIECGECVDFTHGYNVFHNVRRIMEALEATLSKRTDYYREQADDRNAWRDEQVQACMVCGWSASTHTVAPGRHLEVHELASRAQAPGKSHFRASYLLLCNQCHAKVATIGHAKLMAHKAIADVENYDRVAVNTARGLAPDAVSEADVLEEVVNILRPHPF